MTDLIKLLSDLHTQQLFNKDLIKAFDEIAICLLRQTKIVTPKDQFYLREIEIYFFDKKNHSDPYTHKNKRQSEFGEWYFHRYTDINSYIKSNRNGVDITFGNKDAELFGGILIRKIQNIDSNELIIGINKVARCLIENVGENKMNDIALGNGSKVFDIKQPLHLEVAGNNYSSPIYKTQRNGLTFKEDEMSKKYFKSPYCYYNHNLNITQIIEVKPAS
jgi:hypothetical protein